MDIKEKIVVLMSTYNGEKYLPIQIDSILNQKEVDVFLLVRDDGSTDDTIGILKSYASKYSNIGLILERNIGAIWSFYKLIDYAVRRYSDYKYFAFSDQDDYWYPYKLKRAIQMNKKNSGNYLYHSCYDIVDKDLKFIRKSSNMNTLGTLGEALITNPSIGCSEVFTFEVLKNSAKICGYHLADIHYYPYHDLWVYLVALATKAEICYDVECGLKYRQHGNNVIGTGKGWLQTVKLQYGNLVNAKNLKSGFAEILLDLLDLDSDVRDLLKSVSNYRRSLASRLSLIRNKQFCIKNRTRRYGFIYSVLAGIY